MRRVSYAFLISAFCCVMTISHAGAQTQDLKHEVTGISLVADPSLALPLTDIIRDFTRQKHQAVTATFQTISQHETDTADSASYDILITARSKLIESLKLQGIVDIYSEAAIAKNRLVLIARADNDFKARLLDGFPTSELVSQFSWEPGLALGNPETLIEGSLAREALKYYGANDDLEPYTVYIKDISTIGDLVRESGYFTIIFDSDAKHLEGIRIIDLMPEESHAPVKYVAVVLAGDRMNEARKFIEYLKQDTSRRIFESYGFYRP